MQVPVGPFKYNIQLTHHKPIVYGEPALGFCDPDQMVIQIWRGLPPQRRMGVLWHELAHAWHYDLDIHNRPKLTSEALANLVGLAMMSMGPKLLAKLQIFMQNGAECDDVEFARGFDIPIPVLYWWPKHGVS